MCPSNQLKERNMKNIIKILSVFLIIVSINGCSKDLLNQDPETQINELYVFDTPERVLGQVNGMYAYMKSGQFLGGRFYVYNDIRAENFMPKSSNLVTGYATWNHTTVSSTNEIQNLWNAVYAAINSINIFLEGSEKAWADGKLGTVINEATYNQYRSEALTLRAMCYFDLLMLYAQPYNKDAGASPGVPLRLVANKTLEGNDLARSTVAQVYTQILSDLNAAEPIAILDYTSDILRTTRIHRNSIIAFKTRVYLHMSNWTGVIAEASKIVSAAAPFTATTGRAFALNSTFAGIWASPYTTKESVFSMPFTTTNLAGTQNALAHYHHPSSSESYYLNVSGQAYTSLNASDARRTIFQTGTVSSVTRYFVGKWTSYTSQVDYAPVMRYAEVLLNYAEALAKNGGVTQQAVDLLNAVRTRSYTAGAYTLAGFANTQAFVDAVLLERNMEFLGEGLRSLDLLRTMSTIPGKTGVAAVPSTSPTYIWPIPTTELTTNKLMTPNE
jgi:hypothetical protein